MKMFAKVNGFHVKLSEMAGTIDANYSKGVLAHQDDSYIRHIAQWISVPPSRRDKWSHRDL